MESMAITLSIIGVIGFLSFLATQFKTEREGGTKWGGIMKILFNSVAFTLILVLPVLGMQIASNQGWSNLESLMQISMLPVGLTYVIYLFYLIMVYSEDAFEAITGRKNMNKM